MKERITYVVTKPETFNPKQLVLGNHGRTLKLHNIHAAKEHRLTLTLDELPEELRAFFERWRQLHIRWVSSAAYKATPPFTARLSPGLHVFFANAAAAAATSSSSHKTIGNSLCESPNLTLPKSKKCAIAANLAIRLPSSDDTSSSSTPLHYYAYVDSVSQLVTSIQTQFPWLEGSVFRKLLASLPSATYVDIDFDNVSRAVVWTAVWPDTSNQEGWSEELSLPKTNSIVEIGVLNHEANSDLEDIQFGGFLTVLGQDEAPKATRFQTPARHLPLLETAGAINAAPRLHPLTYRTSLSPSTGLHPTLVLSFPRLYLNPPEQTCKLYAYLTLPSYLFIDKYQFEDKLFLRSKNLKRLQNLVGATDLEAPDWTIEQWGSAALFHLADPDIPHTKSPKGEVSKHSRNEERWNVSIPLHTRYMPASSFSHKYVPVPWPVVFWACQANQGEKMAGNPFDRLHLGYEAMFGSKTRFLHVEPDIRGNGTGQLVDWIRIPVIDTRKSEWVEGGTIGVVSAAFLILCWILFGRTGGRQNVQ